MAALLLPHTFILILTAVMVALITLYALRNRQTPGALSFAALMVGIVIWSGCYALELGSTVKSIQILWMKVEPAIILALIWSNDLHHLF